jgi:hypothetical protein
MSQGSLLFRSGLCQSLSKVCVFLGTVGIVRIFIKNFSLHTHPLIKLTRKDKPFIFGLEHIQVQEDLETALLESPALHAIDYTSSAPIILAINTSYIAISIQLCQCDITMPSQCYYNQFCSIMLNDRESKYSQPKLKIYGDTPQVLYPHVDRSQPTGSDAYQSSYAECQCNDSLHTQSQRQITLHSYASNCRNTWRSQSVLPIIIFTLISYDTTYL